MATAVKGIVIYGVIDRFNTKNCWRRSSEEKFINSVKNKTNCLRFGCYRKTF